MKDKTLFFLKINSSLFFDLFKESLKGKTLYRILHNHALKDLTIEGEVLDLGAGSEKSSYLRYLKRKNNVHFTFTDFYKEGKNILKVNLEKKIELKKTYSTILCFNVLEHINNYNNVIKASYSHLKNNATFIGSTPFLIRYHPDPQDYFRYTQTSIRLLFEKEKFKEEKLIVVGLGPFVAGLEQVMIFIPSFLRIFFILPAIFFDLVLLKIFPQYKNKYPLGYVYVFKK